MGKITDALKKITEKQEEMKQTQNIPIAKKVSKQGKTIFTNPNPSVNDNRLSLPKEAIENIKPAKLFIAKTTDDSGIDPRVVTYFDYSSPISEQYRSLRTNIKSCLRNGTQSGKIGISKTSNSPKIITVTSSLHAEGKTLTCVNLAIALAKELDSKVLLIDADLRNGTIHDVLNVNNKPGLSNILTHDYDYSVAFHPTQVRNLFVIPRGDTPYNPSELLGSNRMRLILEELKSESLTYVIIDTPPVMLFADAGIVSAETDGVVFAVQAQRTQNSVVKKAKDTLAQANANILGFVLTQTDYCTPGVYEYYRYRYHVNNKKS